MIVDFTVQDYMNGLIFIRNRLAPPFEVNDTQAATCQSRSRRLVDHETGFVGTAVNLGGIHGLQNAAQFEPGEFTPKNARYSTHTRMLEDVWRHRLKAEFGAVIARTPPPTLGQPTGDASQDLEIQAGEMVLHPTS